MNCAGSLLLKPAHLTTEAEWNQTIEANLTTAYATVRAGAKALQLTGGSIVSCATAAARTGFANHEAIAAAEGGVIGLTLSAAATYGPRNIRVNCVAPGLVDTPLAARITSNEVALTASAAMYALGESGVLTMWRRESHGYSTRRTTGSQARSWVSTAAWGRFAAASPSSSRNGTKPC